MNKSLLKFITDFGPLLIFFTIYYKSGNNLEVAIPPLIISTLVAVTTVYFVDKKIPYVPLIGAIVISIFGGLTLYFDNPIFLYMKLWPIRRDVFCSSRHRPQFTQVRLTRLSREVPQPRKQVLSLISV